MSYEVVITRDAAKSLARIERRQRARIEAVIGSLAEQPRPVGCTKLAGTESGYRVRVGDYRVVYTVDDDRVQVTVVKIGHRRSVYQEL